MTIANFVAVREQAREELRKIPYGRDETSASRWISLGMRQVAEEKHVLAARLRTPTRDAALEARVREILTKLTDTADVDVRHTGPVFAIPLADSGEEDEILRIGSSIARINERGGTLGFFAVDRETGAKGFVSANHVLAGQDLVRPGTRIVHPAGSNNVIGEFVRAVPLAVRGQQRVDCAFAKLTIDAFDPATLPGGGSVKRAVGSVAHQTAVMKFGAASRKTTGIVTEPDQDAFEIHYRFGVGLVKFDDQIEIESDNSAHFAIGGDSGSLVVDGDLRPVGLLFSIAMAGGSRGNGLAYANPIEQVLERLGVDLLV